MIGLNYPPEPTGISPYTGAMAKGLVRREFGTRVLTAHPHYPDWRVRAGYGQWSRRENIEGVDVVRLRHYVPRKPNGVRRALSELSFGVRLATTGWESPDVIVAVSPALLSTWIAMLRARLTNRRAPTIVWVQDLYGLGLSETDQGSRGVVRAINAIERRVLRNASRVIVIHDRFARRVSEDFGIPMDRIEVVRNWTHIPTPPSVDRVAVRKMLGWRSDETVILHAGNMGVKQGLENVVEAARLASQRDENVRFVFLGGGSEKGRLQELAGSISHVQFLDPLPDDEFVAALQTADILLVNEKKGVAEMAVPSKLTSYFNAGKPVLAATDEQGITAQELRAARAGVVVPAGDPAGLLDAAVALAATSDSARTMGENGVRYRHTVLDKETALDRFTEILDSLTSRRSDDERIDVGITERSHK
ncbi:glycosyltransferase family 4 protein [Nesterenkonia muleiensis]|uniref:glycosyltransferase family 4 protein n=1 Tax=Nesterenkonia muleiensis TaxID=2282648 RepID=UPI0023685C20|nr:glycosyltransferase family 4 protein [Nesterenkonia muleiensis]